MTTNGGNLTSGVPTNSVDAAQLVDGWDDLVSELAVGKVTAGAAPSWEQIGTTGIWQYAFSVADQLQVPSFHFLHGLKLNTTVYLHVHWEPKTALSDGDQVKFQLNFRVQKGHNQGAFQSVPFTIEMEYTSSGATPVMQHMITEHSGVGNAILGTTNISDLIEVDSLMQCNFHRVAATTQEFAGEIYGLKVDIHYMKDRLATLNKEPNFYGP